MRAYPASRRQPQFSRASLEASLRKAGIRYVWEGKALGGLRKSYADHMQTSQFQSAAGNLTRMGGRVCIMCAESNPAHCHRSHISDWLVSHGTPVVHLLDLGAQHQHPARLI